jgi:hypothetical protein
MRRLRALAGLLVGCSILALYLVASMLGPEPVGRRRAP